MRGVVQVGTDLATSRWSAEIASHEPRVLAAVALHPNETPELAAAGALDDHLAGIAELAGAPARARRSARPGSTSTAPRMTTGRDAQYRVVRGAHRDRQAARPRAADPRPRRAPARWSRPCGGSARPSARCSTASAATPSSRSWSPTRAGTSRSPARSRSRTPTRLREALEVIPRSRILIETDAPYLTPDAVPRPPERAVPDPAHAARDGDPPRHRRLDARRPDRPRTPSWSTATGTTNTVERRAGPFDRPESGGAGDPDWTGRRWRSSAPPRSATSPTRLDLQPTKKLGQNFVVDGNTVRKIVKTARRRSRATRCSRSGPGLGSLTLGLLEAGARVTAVEIDKRLAAQLPQHGRAAACRARRSP